MNIAFEVQSRYASPDDAEMDIKKRITAKEIVIGFGHPVYTIADPATRSSRRSHGAFSRDAGSTTMFDVGRANRNRDVGHQAISPIWIGTARFPTIVMGWPTAIVHAPLRDCAALQAGARTSSSSVSTNKISGRREYTGPENRPFGAARRTRLNHAIAFRNVRVRNPPGSFDIAIMCGITESTAR